MTDYPQLNLVEPGPVQDALRTLWDGLSEVEGRLEALSAAASLSEVREALQVGGSHQLDVTGLLGRLLQPQPARIAVGMWQQIGNETGAGNFVWDREVVGAPELFVRRAANEEIHLRTNALLLAVASVDVTAASVIRIFQNSAVRARWQANAVPDHTNTLSTIISGTAGDRIYVDSSAGNRNGGVDPANPTLLALIRLS